MPSYLTSEGVRVEKSVIDARVKKAKALKIKTMFENTGYIFCEDCNVNKNAGRPLDCSHDISVKDCQDHGYAELAYHLGNITIRCRNCHNKHDKTNLW